MKKLKMQDVLAPWAYKYMTAAERRLMLKAEQAKECSGWRRYPDISNALIERIPEAWWNKYTAEHIGEVMQLLKAAYDDGRQHPSPDEYQPRK